MDVLMILCSTLLFSLQFVFHNIYTKKYGSGLAATVSLSLYTGIFGFLILLGLNAFVFRFSWFSALIAFVAAASALLQIWCSAKAFETANLSLYSMFTMLGGMALPFAFGLMIGEDFTWLKALCFVLITASLVISLEKGESQKGALKYYVAVFILNGMSGVLSTIHNMGGELAVDSYSYSMLIKTIQILLCVGILLVKKTPPVRLNLITGLGSFGYAAFSSIGNLLLLLALVTLPASVQYPIVTGGVIVISTAITLLRKEKVTKRELIAAVIACGATVLIAL